MCLNPISIVNPTKYISLKYRDPYLLQVPCGKCAECQSTLSAQWMFRSFVEFNDVFHNGGFVYFDTFTYDNKSVPKFSDIIEGTDYEFFCFNHEHITNFFKLLRIRLKRAGINVFFKYFLSSEYGMNPQYKGKNRPHYHVVFYVYGKVNPLEFSRLVSEVWSYGRTDGSPYKSGSYVLSHNVIAVNNTANVLRTANYVTKYVQKSCEFQRELDKRVNIVMNDFAKHLEPENPEQWLKSAAALRVRRKLVGSVNQFHRQSLHYGESALSDIDLNQLFNDGCLYMPHYKGVKVPILLPTYYKRKLFYRLVEVDGCKSWQLNELGLEYREARRKKLNRDLVGRLQAVCVQHHLDYNCKRLADYVMYERGRIKALLPESTLEQRIGQLDLFNYVTIQDKDNLCCRGLTPQWLGNSTIGYSVEVMPPHISIKQFIDKYIIIDADREKELSHIYYLLSFIDRGKQDAYELKQRLTNKFKVFLSAA